MRVIKMIERVHEHIISELQQNARTDTIFVLKAILPPLGPCTSSSIHSEA